MFLPSSGFAPNRNIAWPVGAAAKVRGSVARQRRGDRWTRMVGKVHEEGRLRARPEAEVISASPVGLRPLGLDAPRDGYLYVPTTYRMERPAPLVVLLHGAGEDARDGLAMLRGQAD